MTLKQYRIVKLIFVIAIAIVFSQLIFSKNYIIPIAILMAASLILILLRRKVKEIIADERDYLIGGKAALWAIQIYSWLAVIAMFVFYGLRDINPAYEPIGMTLAFSTCLLMFVYGATFRYFDKFKFSNKKTIYTVIIIIIVIILAIASLRLFSGEDNWVCQNGQWIEHGHPDFLAPTIECK
jgi:uncharacterized membrane protein